MLSLNSGMASPITFTEDYSSFDLEVYIKLLRHKSLFNVTVQSQAYPVTDQDNFNICWIFVGTGICRLQISAALNTHFLEISQDYVYYYYWIYRIEHFFERVKDTIGLPRVSPKVQPILTERFPDEGNMEIFLFIVRHVGIIPRAGYKFLRHSPKENIFFFEELRIYLINCARGIRLLSELFIDQTTIPNSVKFFKTECFKKLKNFTGAPPINPSDTFNYEYCEQDDSNKKITYTPLGFMDEFCPFLKFPYAIVRKSVDQVSHELYKENIFESSPASIPVTYWNLKIEKLVEIVVHCLSENIGVYAAFELDSRINFRSDVLNNIGLTGERKKNIKHSMIIIGASNTMGTDDILHLRLENSYGSKIGIEGHHSISIKFFKDYILEIAVPLYIVNSILFKN